MASASRAFVRRVAAYFDLQGNGTDFETEIKSGVHSFSMTMYVLILNAQLMKHAGINPGQTVVTTCLTAFIGTFLVGFFGNLPFVIAPGLGVTSYLAYYLVGAGVMSVTEAMTCAFIASVIAVLLAFFGITEWCLKGIPQTIKSSIIIGVGLGLASIALENGGLAHWIESPLADSSAINFGLSDTNSGLELTSNRKHLNIASPWLTVLGIIVATALFRHVYSLPLTIFFMIIANGMLQASSIIPRLPPQPWLGIPGLPNIGTYLDLSSIGMRHCLAILGFLCASTSDISGVMHGLARQAGFVEPGQLNVPNGTWGYLSAATASAFATSIGCSPAVVYVESGAGIERGGRTGLTALVAAFGFIVAMWFAPFFGHVPDSCTAPVLVLAGASMTSQFQQIPWAISRHAVSAFFTIIIIARTFSLYHGLLVGCFVYVVLWLCAGGLWAILPSMTDIQYTLQLAYRSRGDQPPPVPGSGDVDGQLESSNQSGYPPDLGSPQNAQYIPKYEDMDPTQGLYVSPVRSQNQSIDADRQTESSSLIPSRMGKKTPDYGTYVGGTPKL